MDGPDEADIPKEFVMLRSAMIASTALLALTLAPLGTMGADRPDVNRTDYTAVGLAGHPELRSGGILDVTFGRERGAIEIHHVTGAAPATDYLVIGDVFFASACSPDEQAIPVDEGILTTDAQGAGHFRIDLPGAAFDAAPDAFWVRWRLEVSGSTAYQSGCVQVEL